MVSRIAVTTAWYPKFTGLIIFFLNKNHQLEYKTFCMLYEIQLLYAYIVCPVHSSMYSFSTAKGFSCVSNNCFGVSHSALRGF